MNRIRGDCFTRNRNSVVFTFLRFLLLVIDETKERTTKRTNLKI